VLNIAIKRQLASSSRAVLLCAGAALLLTACSPKFNWRQVQGNDAPYSVLLPAKPSTLAREIDLDGVKVSMTMTATKVDDTVFAVGSAKLADTSQAAAALQAMKTALVKNINGSVKSEKASADSIDLEAGGTVDSGSQPKVLFAHLQSKGQYIYQVVVIGPQKAVTRENVDMFISSFKAS